MIKSEQFEISKEENYIINIEALLEIQDILINKINNNNIDIKIKNEFIFQYIKNIEIIKKNMTNMNKIIKTEQNTIIDK